MSEAECRTKKWSRLLSLAKSDRVDLIESEFPEEYIKYYFPLQAISNKEQIRRRVEEQDRREARRSREPVIYQNHGNRFTDAGGRPGGDDWDGYTQRPSWNGRPNEM